MDRLSVLIVDNSIEVSKELELVLLDFDPMHARRSASTPDEAVTVGKAFRPDVIIYDLPLAGSQDAQVIRQLRKLLPATRIIAISLYDHYGEAALKAGADEFVSKTATRSVFLSALGRQCLASGHQSD